MNFFRFYRYLYSNVTWLIKFKKSVSGSNVMKQERENEIAGIYTLMKSTFADGDVQKIRAIHKQSFSF